MKVCQVNGLWPMKYCAKDGANLYSLTCNLLQGDKTKIDHKNNIVIQSFNCNIILGCQIKTHDYWIARVEFFQETGHERSQLVRSSTEKDIYVLHIDLGHPSKVITYENGREMGLHLTGIFKPHEDCTPGMTKEGHIIKGCQALQNLGREAVFQYQLTSDSHS